MKAIEECLSSEIKTIAIVGHVHPDGDCAGSVLSLYRYITENYHQYAVTPFLEPLTADIAFLADGIAVNESDGACLCFDLCISCDASDIGRIGAGLQAFQEARETVCIDHHETNPHFATTNHVEGDTSSCCEVLCGLYDMNKVSLKTAECLYTGMVHDSGVFKYSSTSPETLRRAALLLEKGVDFSSIILHSITEKPYKEAKANARVLSESTFLSDESFIYAMASLELQNELQVTARDLHSAVVGLNEVKGAETVLFLYQIDEENWKGSLRSKERVDVAAIAATMGGGGHKRAAGFSCKGDMNAVINKVRELIKVNE